MSEVTNIELVERYVGMPDTMQGGYVAGLAAGDADGPVRVQIRKPMYPGEVLVRTVKQNDTMVHRNDELVMVATPGPLHVQARSPISRQAVDAAMKPALPFDPPYPNCIGCGHSPDGLGVRIRALGDQRHAVAIWSPTAEWGDTNGVVPRHLIWTAFDCVTSWAIFVDPPNSSDGGAVTGNIAAEFRGDVLVGETYVFQSWRERDGNRNIICGGALYGPDGLVAVADQELIRTTGWGMEIPTAPLLG